MTLRKRRALWVVLGGLVLVLVVLAAVFGGSDAGVGAVLLVVLVGGGIVVVVVLSKDANTLSTRRFGYQGVTGSCSRCGYLLRGIRAVGEPPHVVCPECGSRHRLLRPGELRCSACGGELHAMMSPTHPPTQPTAPVETKPRRKGLDPLILTHRCIECNVCWYVPFVAE